MSLALISAATKCRCVGIRVEDEGDLPLVRSLGFSEDFVNQELSLLPRDMGETLDLDIKERLALLECLCGRVIRGDRSGCEELFTAKGSFWRNDFSDTEKIPPGVQEEMRDACMEEGFQSFVLVPCHPDHQTLALLHLCDTRRGLLSEKLVAGLEETGEHLAKLLFELRELKKAASQPPEAKPKQLRVLVVDDEVEMASLAEQMLELQGHQVTATFSAPGALDMLSKQKFDIVLADFSMPVMSGMGLAREIRKRWQPYAPPVILMSGTSAKEMPFREEETPDVAAFLSKPFSVYALTDAIHKAMGQEQQ